MYGAVASTSRDCSSHLREGITWLAVLLLVLLLGEGAERVLAHRSRIRHERIRAWHAV